MNGRFVGMAAHMGCRGLGWRNAILAPNLGKNGSVTNQIGTRNAFISCNHLCMDAVQDKQSSIWDEWAVCGYGSTYGVPRVGWRNAILAPNLGKKGSVSSQIVMRNATIISCNHLCMDAMQAKQNSIRDEWVVCGYGGTYGMPRVGFIDARQFWPQILSRKALSPAKL